MTYIKAKSGPPNYGDNKKKFTVQYFDEDGNMIIRSGGTRAWRCNNPGALLASSYSMGKDRHPIGSAGDDTHSYAVYPDYETGHEALIVMLRGSKYSPLSLREASKRYVKEDPNHIHKIIKLTNNRLNADQKIKNLTNDEFEIYWKAIETNEKWEEGKEDFIARWYISGVHKKHGIITEYFVNSNWISKAEALKLATEHRLHATIVHLKNGTEYLRPEYGASSFKLIT